MESRRGVTGVAAPAPAQGRCHLRGDGGSGDETDGSSSGVELSLRLQIWSRPPAAQAEEEVVEETPAAAPAPARRSMTLFYNGRVCAVDVTEIQAREIIAMASQEILGDQQQQRVRRDDRQVQDSCSSSSIAMARCDGQVRLTAPPPAGDPVPRQGRLAEVAAPVVDQAAMGLSMKRSLQRFLQKRKVRVTAAVAPPYAGARQAQPLRR